MGAPLSRREEQSQNDLTYLKTIAEAEGEATELLFHTKVGIERCEVALVGCPDGDGVEEDKPQAALKAKLEPFVAIIILIVLVK